MQKLSSAAEGVNWPVISVLNLEIHYLMSAWIGVGTANEAIEVTFCSCSVVDSFVCVWSFTKWRRNYVGAGMFGNLAVYKAFPKPAESVPNNHIV